MPEKMTSLSSSAQALIGKFTERNATVAIIGLGYVGLPLAVVLADSGLRVVGLDTSEEKINSLRDGQSYIEDVPSEVVQKHIDEKRIIPTNSYDDLMDVDAISICVPTPLRKTGDPDLSYIINVSTALKPILHPGLLVILESTTYPGTTRELIQPELETSELVIGEDIFLAFSPERVDPGREDWTTVNTPKVIGGITPSCTEVAAVLYEQAMETVVRVSSTEVAEMTKLLENTFRAVNIGLVNELAIICHRLGLDVWEVIEAAASKPFGYMKFTPGPGLGGHCIPIDPLYLSWKLKSLNYNARFIDLASEINTNMPRYVVQRIQDTLNKLGSTVNETNILILGVAYKPNVSDMRESPALDVIGLLKEKGANISFHDPYVQDFWLDDIRMTSEDHLLDAVKRADCVVIITDHEDLDYSSVAKESKILFDTRNVTGRFGLVGENIVRL